MDAKSHILNYYPEPFINIISTEMRKYTENYLTDLGLGKFLDPHFYSKNFFKNQTKDITIDVNANAANTTMVQYLAEFSKAHLFLNNLYLLFKALRKKHKSEKQIQKVFEHIFNGDIYIHDKHHFGQVPYCYAYDCMDWVIEGIPKLISPSLDSDPAKHFDSFLQHTENLVIFFSNSQSGAVAFPNLFPVLAWFIKKDRESGYLKDDWKQKVKQRLQSFIFNLNQNTRVGNQSPFSNLSYLDKVFMDKLFKNIVFPDGSKYDINATIELQDMFMECMKENYNKKPFTFPVMTGAVAVDNSDEENIKVLDEEMFDKMIEHDLHRGAFNWLFSPPNQFSSCCRLKNDLTIYKTNSFGSSGVKIGSIGVCTLVLPNIALNGSNIDEVTRIACEIMEIKRELLQNRIDQGKLPLYSLGWINLATQYSTIGITGLKEFAELSFDFDFYSEECEKVIKIFLNDINEITKEYSKIGEQFNVELVPAENVGVKMAKLSRIRGLHKYPLFSNQIIPHDTTMDMFDRIKYYSKYESYFSGGCIWHINQDTHLDSKKILKQLLTHIYKSGASFVARNEVVGICEKHHVIPGINPNSKQEPKCPKCGSNFIDFRDRIVGYQVSISNFSEVRKKHDWEKRYRYNFKEGLDENK